VDVRVEIVNATGLRAPKYNENLRILRHDQIDEMKARPTVDPTYSKNDILSTQVYEYKNIFIKILPKCRF